MSQENKTKVQSLTTLPAKYEGLELSPAKGVRQSANDLYLRAQIILQSGMAPSSFKNVKELVYALGMGQDLGFTNLQSLANIAVINNRPSVYADGLPTILLRSGHFFMEEFSGTIEDGTYKASITIERKDSGSVITREFSVEDAKRAGLWQTEARITKRGRNGSYECDNDSPWWKYPKRMIWRRAIGWAVRDALADEMYGLQIVEEMNDHLVTIEAAAEPKTSKLSDKLKGMDEAKDEIIEIDIEEEDIVPGEAALEDAEPELAEDIDIMIEQEDEDAFFEDEVGDVGAEEAQAPEEDVKSFDSNGRNLPGLALDWFDYLNSPVFDVNSFDKDFADEQEQAWFKALSEEDREYVIAETNKIVAEQKKGAE